jgi:hypothetical protein
VHDVRRLPRHQLAAASTSAAGRAGAVTVTLRTAPRGRAVVTVSDRSTKANLHLAGPGVNRRTGRTFMGRVTWSLRLRPGMYRFGSDPRLTGLLRVG